MATSVRLTCLSRPFQSIFLKHRLISLNSHSTIRNKLQFRSQSSWNNNRFHYKNNKYALYGLTAGIATVAGGVALVAKCFTQPVAAETGTPTQFTPSRSIRHESDTSGLKLTLFQYQTCPFCCKARAYLDYYGFSYDVIEVNSVWRTETKWTKYRKVPILVCHDVGNDGFLQINDSSVIISCLDSYLEDPSLGIETLLGYYPTIETKNKKGKTVLEFPNKYFIMFGEKDVKCSSPDERKEERIWRTWVDDTFVHYISPNIYRSAKEAKQAFQYFDETGEWEKNFSKFERFIIHYVGAYAMLYVGKMLKKRHHLEEDVRLSLYKGCNEWVNAIGPTRTFMGGEKPNLADLAMYGVLNAMEGCEAFQDALNNTKLKPWYEKTKYAVVHHLGNQSRLK